MAGGTAESEKSRVAAGSVLGAVGLTALKIIVGVSTGSLGILAEAAHSALDLVAAVLTWFAVRVAGKPPDRGHPYGHGKSENLSAFVETLLLAGTCCWIIYSSVHRLVTGIIEIEVTVWSFVVMAVSIVVDISRSRLLYAAARKHNSQALEADALHFSTDIWSSAVVILGLASVKAADWFPSFGFLRSADAIAALVVAAIVAQVSAKLGVRTVQALLDAAPSGLEERIIQTVESVPGVDNCHNVRARYSGAQLFVDVHVLVDGEQTLRQAHDLTEAIEAAIQGIAADCDVTVHPEPRGAGAGPDKGALL